MNTDRLLLMVIVVTGFVVLIAGWAGGLVQAEATGLGEFGLFGALALVFVAVTLGIWHWTREVDEERSEPP